MPVAMEVPVRLGLPLVLAASVSAQEQRRVESMLKDAGFEVRRVHGADDAEDEISGHDGSCVLVVDSGLLEMRHNDEWRGLRARHPELGTVVRCLIKMDPGIQRKEPGTFLVHPDHSEGLLQALRALGAIGEAPHRWHWPTTP